MKVDGQSIAKFTIDQIAERIMGPIGTTVTLSMFEQDSGTTVDVPLVRAEIQVTNVSWQMVPGTTVADVRVSAFAGGSRRGCAPPSGKRRAGRHGGGAGPSQQPGRPAR